MLGANPEESLVNPIHDLLDRYGQTHTHPVNRRIHFACVPLIVLVTVGLGWGVHAGLLVDTSVARGVNLGTLGSLAALVFYARLGARALAWMAGFLLVCNAFCAAYAFAGGPILLTSAALWAAAWGAQFVGHHYEGAKPSFTDDLIFLLVGPLFVLEELGAPVRPQASPAVTP